MSIESIREQTLATLTGLANSPRIATIEDTLAPLPQPFLARTLRACTADLACNAYLISYITTQQPAACIEPLPCTLIDDLRVAFIATRVERGETDAQIREAWASLGKLGALIARVSSQPQPSPVAEPSMPIAPVQSPPKIAQEDEEEEDLVDKMAIEEIARWEKETAEDRAKCATSYVAHRSDRSVPISGIFPRASDQPRIAGDYDVMKQEVDEFREALARDDADASDAGIQDPHAQPVGVKLNPERYLTLAQPTKHPCIAAAATAAEIMDRIARDAKEEYRTEDDRKVHRYAIEPENPTRIPDDISPRQTLKPLANITETEVMAEIARVETAHLIAPDVPVQQILDRDLARVMMQ